MREIVTDIVIDAAPARVWQVLTDFARYPVWNPFIRRIASSPSTDAPLRRGARLTVALQPPGARDMSFRPTLRVVDEARELSWLGRLGVPGLFDGEHRFVLQPQGANRTRLWQRERFAGLLVPLLWRQIAGPTRDGFAQMNTALKQRVETGAALRR